MNEHVSYNVIGKKVSAENGPEIVFTRTKDFLTSPAVISTVPTPIQGYNSSKYEVSKSKAVITAERIDMNTISRRAPISTKAETAKPISTTATKRPRSLTPHPHKTRVSPAPPRVLTEEEKEKERQRQHIAAVRLAEEKAQVLYSCTYCSTS